MKEYPKSLYAKGWSDLSAHRIVKDAAEEDAARADGFKHMSEFPHPDTAAITHAGGGGGGISLGAAGGGTGAAGGASASGGSAGHGGTTGNAVGGWGGASSPEIPVNWRALSAADLKALAVALGAEAKGLSKAEAIEFIAGKEPAA